MTVEFFEHPFRAATGRKRYQHWTALVSLHAPFPSRLDFADAPTLP